MKIIATNTTQGSWIWIGGKTLLTLMSDYWRHYSYETLIVEKIYEPKTYLFRNKNVVFITELSVEQLLTCNDCKIREWAAKQVEVA